MKFKVAIATLFAIGALVISPSLARAQEGEPVVVDEVIAQVNDGVVTLSQLKREMKERVDTLKQNGMSEAQANAEVEKHKSELIATLINEQLLLQKGKDLDLTEKVEAEVNRRMRHHAENVGFDRAPSFEQRVLRRHVDLDVHHTLGLDRLGLLGVIVETVRALQNGVAIDPWHAKAQRIPQMDVCIDDGAHVPRPVCGHECD